MLTIADARKLIGARKVIEVCANVACGESVLVVADANTARIGELLAVVSLGITDNTVLAVIPPPVTHGAEPPEGIACSMKKSDVVLMPLTFSMTHTSAVEEARAGGTRIISMGDVTETMLESGGIEADFPKLRKVVEKAASFLTDGREIRLTTPKGTDIVMRISGRNGNAEPGLSHEPGAFSSPPNMEVNIGPLEDTANGRLVIDAAVTHPELRMIQDPINLTVEKGRITEIRGGAQASALRAVLAQMNDQAIYNIAELGIGLNPCSRICGRMLEDEGVYGTAHIGIGDNTAYGGHVSCEGHIDLVMYCPTIDIDGTRIQEDGRFTFDLEGVKEYSA